MICVSAEVPDHGTLDAFNHDTTMSAVPIGSNGDYFLPQAFIFDPALLFKTVLREEYMS